MLGCIAVSFMLTYAATRLMAYRQTTALDVILAALQGTRSRKDESVALTKVEKNVATGRSFSAQRRTSSVSCGAARPRRAEQCTRRGRARCSACSTWRPSILREAGRQTGELAQVYSDLAR